MSDLLSVGVVGPARGLRGEMLVRPTTDQPEERFAPGETVSLSDGRVLEVAGARVISNRLCVFFVGVDTREDAEALRGETLWAPPLAEDDGYYACDLVGLVAVDTQGRTLGEVSGMRQGAVQDLLTVATPSGEVLVPFVDALVPEVDLAGQRVVIDPPAGLFDAE